MKPNTDILLNDYEWNTALLLTILSDGNGGVSIYVSCIQYPKHIRIMNKTFTSGKHKQKHEQKNLPLATIKTRQSLSIYANTYINSS